MVVIGPKGLDYFATNIAAGFEARGTKAFVIDPLGAVTFRGNRLAESAHGPYVMEAVKRLPGLRRQVVDRHVEEGLRRCDPLLVICVWGEISPQQVETWRKLTPSAAWVFWYPDAISNLGNHKMLLAPYDRFFFKDPYLVDLLSSRTALPVHMLAQACNPLHHRPEEPYDDAERAHYACDVAIAGNPYPYRMLVMDILPESLDLRVYGNRRTESPAKYARFSPKTTGQYVVAREKSLAFRGAKVCLNTMHYAEIRGVNTRLFEGTGCGAFVISQTSMGIGDYYELGTEIVAVDTRSELREAVMHYVDPATEDERRRIAEAGCARAHREHTYPMRVGEMCKVLGIADKLGLRDWVPQVPTAAGSNSGAPRRAKQGDTPLSH